MLTVFSTTSSIAELEVISEENRPLAPADIAPACQSGMVWQAFPKNSRDDGVGGLYDDVLVRFTYARGRAPLAALRTLDQDQLARIPALAAAVLTAATSRTDPPIAGPLAIATLCNRAPAARQADAALPSRADLQRQAAGALRALARDNAFPPAPAGVLTSALYYQAIGEQLWRTEMRQALARVPATSPHYSDLILLAGGHAEWAALTDVETCGSKLRLPTEDRPGAWASLFIYEANGMRAEQARFLFGNNLPPILECLATEYPPLAAAELDLQRGIVTALLREAVERAAYAPYGGFYLALPADYPLRTYGIDAWRVWAEPTGLWFLPISNGKIGAGYWWTPTMYHQTLVAGQTTHLTGLLEVTAAALWRDLCVAGERVIRPRGAAATRSAGSQPPSPASRTQNTRTLPARRIVLTGAREWSDAAEREAITRRAHGVRGHLRTLHTGWTASSAAYQVAEDFNLPIPDGYTFVRPHTRGDNAPSETPQATPIQARGLATVMALLR